MRRLTIKRASRCGEKGSKILWACALNGSALKAHAKAPQMLLDGLLSGGDLGFWYRSPVTISGGVNEHKETFTLMRLMLAAAILCAKIKNGRFRQAPFLENVIKFLVIRTIKENIMVR